MLFVCKNSEMGIFLDNFHKIYQNGNYKREVIEMVTRMEYLQKLLDWKDEKVIKVIPASGVVVNPHCSYSIRSI